MIAVDTSAILAILLKEAAAVRIRSTLDSSESALISTGNLLELQIVIAGRTGGAAWTDAEALLRKYRVAIHPFDERQLAIAREAALRFGKGRHKAKLNFGDCFAYALARSEGIALLCTGTDFAQTDIEIA